MAFRVRYGSSDENRQNGHKKKGKSIKKRDIDRKANLPAAPDKTEVDSNDLMKLFPDAVDIAERFQRKSRIQLISDAEYMDILVSLLLKPYDIDSLCKLVFIAFGVKYNCGMKVYANRKKDLVQVFMSALSIKLLSHMDDMHIIIEQLYILESNGWISISEKGKVELTSEDGVDIFHPCNSFLNHFKGKEINPINAVNRLDDQAFLEEVLRYI